MKRDNNIYLFRILDEVSKNSNVTQRGLSQRLGVALGLTNLYLKRLAKKGFIKVVNLKPNRLRYELTPSGIAQKTSFAFQYIQESYHFFREARTSLTTTFERMKAAGARSVILYGTGDLAEIALLSLQEVHLDIVAVVCDGKAGQNLCGRPILKTHEVSSLDFDYAIVIDSDVENATRAMSEAGVNISKIVRIGA